MIISINILKTTIFLGIIASTGQEMPTLVPEMGIYQELSSVINAIKRCDSTVTFEMDGETNQIQEAIKIIENHDSANFKRQKLSKIPIKGLSYMKRIKYLNLAENSYLKITKDDIDFLKEKEITEIDLGECECEIQHIEWLVSIPSLKKLDISFNNLTLLAELKHLDSKSIEINIEELSIGYSNIDFDGFKTILLLFKKLTCLDISGSPLITETIPDDEKLDFGNLKNKLKVLKIRNIGFNLQWLDSIIKLERLEHLDISYNWETINAMEDYDIATFGQLRDRLVHLEMASSSVNIKWLEEICTFKKLESLNIDENESLNCDDFADLGINCLLQLESLKSLYMRDCNIDSDIIEKIKKIFKMIRPNARIISD